MADSLWESVGESLSAGCARPSNGVVTGGSLFSCLIKGGRMEGRTRECVSAVTGAVACHLILGLSHIPIKGADDEGAR
jgi:hypothetical protein